MAIKKGVGFRCNARQDDNEGGRDAQRVLAGFAWNSGDRYEIEK
jgi:hypothetical protein